MPNRQEMWERLGEPVDLLVIGGGINGAGIARDAARRGLKVAMIEMRDLAYGTSSRSSKLVHGGLRYLEQLELSLVFEAVSERRILLDIAPHIVNPLGFLFPVFKGSRRGLTIINAGMWLYEGLSLFRSPKRPRKLSVADVEREEPCLKTDGLKGAPLYFDCSTDDARLTLESALDAADQGALVATWAKVVGLDKDDRGMVCGAVVEDAFSGARKTVKAHTVINATGPWTDTIVAMSAPDGDRPMLRPTKGSHVVVDRAKLPVQNAVVCFHPDDGRVLFAIPWGDRTYLGTTDTDYTGDPADVYASAEDVDYLISASNLYFPDNPIDHDDIIATWSGLRPLMSPPVSKDNINESAVSREHQIIVGQDRLITIAGGKLTTFRRMSAEVVDTAVKLLRLMDALPANITDAHTDRVPLPGAVEWPEDDDHDRVAAQVREVCPQLSPATCRLLTDTYGMRALDVARLVNADAAQAAPLVEGRPEILAQVTWAVERELAATVSDILIRRTQLFYRDLNQGLDAAPVIGQHMGRLLGWDDARAQAMVDDYAHTVAQSRRWREERAARAEADA